jgi:BirA family transcriptional regulator, biotin operon repressor / biotin---[acetyl-CoA-carboxylase] ligase
VVLRVVRLAVTPSTQDIARRLPVGSCVVTDYQTAGRGRRDRRWDAPPQTALLASFVLPMRRLALFAAGVAAAEACGPRVRLKWPNDLTLDDAKLGGLLAEQRGERCVVGMGINLQWAPPGGARLDRGRDELLEAVCAHLGRWFAAPDDEVLATWRLRSDTLGRMVRAHLPDGVLEGRAERITVDGALVVAGRVLTVADVVHLRSEAAAARAHAPSSPMNKQRP